MARARILHDLGLSGRCYSPGYYGAMAALDGKTSLLLKAAGALLEAEAVRRFVSSRLRLDASGRGVRRRILGLAGRAAQRRVRSGETRDTGPPAFFAKSTVA
jgi:hypothetical protein